jgi:hypothetical protein
MIAYKNENMRHLCIVTMLLITSSVYQPCDADSSDSVDKGLLLPPRLVKLERMMRHEQQHFTPIESATAVDETNRHGGHVQPAQQIALFRASAKQRIADRLTQLFDSTRNMERARQMAKDRINQHIKEMMEEDDDNARNDKVRINQHIKEMMEEDDDNERNDKVRINQHIKKMMEEDDDNERNDKVRINQHIKKMTTKE